MILILLLNGLFNVKGPNIKTEAYVYVTIVYNNLKK